MTSPQLKTINSDEWKWSPKNHRSFHEPADPEPPDNIEEEEERGIKDSERLVELFEGEEFFHSPEKEPFITLNLGNRFEILPINNRNFEYLISHRFFDRYRRVPSSYSLKDAIGNLAGRALFEGAEHPVYTRVASGDEDFYLDLCNEGWQAVRISKTEWRVVAPPRVKFRRFPGNLTLPTPVSGGTIDELRPFLNINNFDWPLLVSFLLGALNPKGPYPVLVIYGVQGAAKSTLCRIIRSLVDPHTAPVRSLPRDERDLVVSARNSHLLCFDNVSKLTQTMSDALCRLATGGGHSTRKLYTDDQEIFFNGQRPILLNGISEFVVRSDLQDRSIIIDLPPILPENRQDEKTFWKKFYEARPRILGSLLNALCYGLANYDTVAIKSSLRMADFCKWAQACEPGLGWTSGTIVSYLLYQKKRAIHDAVETDPFAQIILQWAPQEGWQGTATELYAILSLINTIPYANGPMAFPGNPKALSQRLRQLASNLREIGIQIDFDRKSYQKQIIIKKSLHFAS